MNRLLKTKTSRGHGRSLGNLANAYGVEQNSKSRQFFQFVWNIFSLFEYYNPLLAQNEQQICCEYQSKL